jgi:aconitase A
VVSSDIWPSSDEIHALMKYATNGKAFRANYAKVIHGAASCSDPRRCRVKPIPPKEHPHRRAATSTSAAIGHFELVAVS